MSPAEGAEAISFHDPGTDSVNFSWKGRAELALFYVNNQRRFAGSVFASSYAYAHDSFLAHQVTKAGVLDSSCAFNAFQGQRWRLGIAEDQFGAHSFDLCRYMFFGRAGDEECNRRLVGVVVTYADSKAGDRRVFHQFSRVLFFDGRRTVKFLGGQ